MEQFNLPQPMENVIGRECKYANYQRGIDSNGNYGDILIVNEVLHYKDGTKFKRMITRENYEREFWVTRPHHRKHQDKKEWENLDYLQCYRAPQHQLPNAVLRALNKPYPQSGYISMRDVNKSPYVYGTDIGTPSIIKHMYSKRWPEAKSKYEVAVFDVETNMIDGSADIICASLTFKDKIAVFVDKRWYEYTNAALGYEDLSRKIYELAPEILERAPKIEYYIVENDMEIVQGIVDKTHEWFPDFITGWNLDYDIQRIVHTCNKYNVNLGDLFRFPGVPQGFGSKGQYRRGQAYRISDSGKKLNLMWHEQWHVLNIASPIYWVDAGSVYSTLRKQKGKLHSYSLDSILQREINQRKLTIPEAEPYTGVDKHIYMQKHHPLEYVVYNIWDCVGLELLDEKTGDLSTTFASQCGVTEFTNFMSNPTKLCNKLHFFLLENSNKVLGSTSSDMKHPLDQFVVPLSDWIVTLDCFLLENHGLKIWEDFPDLNTMVHMFAADIDVKSSYPSTEIHDNVSKETTMMEIVEIEGLTINELRECGLNMMAGRVNATQFCRKVYGLPDFETLSNAFMDEVDNTLYTDIFEDDEVEEEKPVMYLN